MRPARKSDRLEYYEYALLHANDTLAISENAENALKEKISKCFELKPEPIRLPKTCLRGSRRKALLENGIST